MNNNKSFKIIEDITFSGNSKNFRFKRLLPEKHNFIISNLLDENSAQFRKTDTYKSNLEIYQNIVEQLRFNGSFFDYKFSADSSTALLN